MAWRPRDRLFLRSLHWRSISDGCWTVSDFVQMPPSRKRTRDRVRPTFCVWSSQFPLFPTLTRLRYGASQYKFWLGKSIGTSNGALGGAAVRCYASRHAHVEAIS